MPIAGAALAESLRVMGEWLDDRLWLAGAAPSLAEAAVSPVYVRLEALRRLGFTGAVDAKVTAHRDRCTDLAGWAAVAWSDRQTDELVDRSTRHRARARRASAG
jgi:glutathione S-transferase